jgi:SecD/SecF fusion protein
MQGKGVVRFFLIALTVVCLLQYLLIWPTSNVESKAEQHAKESVEKNASRPDSLKVTYNQAYSTYLDSISNETVFSIPLIKKYTYNDLKKSQLGMGLDLKGGMSMLLQVELAEFIQSLSGKSTDPGFLAAVEKAKQMQTSQQSDFISLFAQAWKETGGGRPLASIFARNEALKGSVNFDSPDNVVVEVMRKEANGVVEQTYKRLKQRIDKLGVVQPNVNLDAQRDLINVELPGIDNPKRARDMVKQQAKLEFWETYRISDNGIAQALVDADNKLRAMIGDTLKKAPGDTTAAQAGPLLKALSLNGAGAGPVMGYADRNKRETIINYLKRPEIKSGLPGDIMFAWAAKPISSEEEGVQTLVGKYELYALRKYRNQDEPALDGSVVTNASEQPDPTSGEVTVSLQMNNDGAKAWAELTKKAFDGGNREIAIVLDNEVVSAPRVINPITGGSSSITGNFTIEEAKDLSNILEVGKLPAGIRIVQESQVGPSLGQENINKSLFTMILSVLVLCGFMAAYYARGGWVSVIALLANIFFIIGTLASIGTVLTLPGIAGIVLTLAGAVDANVIIFERIREELRAGMDKVKAIGVGFSRALPAIIDANVTTLLVAFVLIYFGLGPIKGFGTVLLVGIFCSLFTAILVARFITDWRVSKGDDMTYSRPWSENVLTNVRYDWIGKRKYAYLVSGVIILIGVISFFMRGFELGVDFKGGYSFNVQFEQPVDADQLRAPLTTAFGGNPIVKKVNTANTLNITTSYLSDDRSGEAMEKVIAKLHEGIAAAGISVPLESFKNTSSTGTHIVSSSQVGATVADDIRDSSYKAGLWALALIFLYLLVRFNRWQFSLGAVLALFHDVLITLTFFTLLHGIVPFSLEIDQAIIACILTVIGYSVNDTVIVYDRIREFITTFAGRPKEEVFNRAINTTLTRTLITSGTVATVVLLLFLFGGSATKGFAFGMLVGMIFGTYSSIFVASALVVDLTRDKILSGKAPVTATTEGEALSAKKPSKATAK